MPIQIEPNCSIEVLSDRLAIDMSNMDLYQSNLMILFDRLRRFDPLKTPIDYHSLKSSLECTYEPIRALYAETRLSKAINKSVFQSCLDSNVPSKDLVLSLEALSITGEPDQPDSMITYGCALCLVCRVCSFCRGLRENWEDRRMTPAAFVADLARYSGAAARWGGRRHSPAGHHGPESPSAIGDGLACHRTAGGNQLAGPLVPGCCSICSFCGGALVSPSWG
jgi:hypothetical protein